LRKFLPISLEQGWFCTLALKSKPPDFLSKSFLDPQHVISPLNIREKRGTPHRLAASGSFPAPSFYAGPESGVTNSKKIKKMQNLRMTSFYMTYKWEKIQT
jgi:hypothetical protein